MTKDEIVAKVKVLDLPKGSYIVFGSCPMAATGIREAGDIDMLVSKELFNYLADTGWKISHKGEDDNPLVNGDFEAHENWDFSSYSPTLEHLLATAMVIDDVPFAALAEVRKWKSELGRPKDIKDIQLIDKYLATKNSSKGL